MKIDKIRLKNFRCFEDISIEFSPNVNIIIGDNGAGKSTLLRGLCVGASSFLLGIDKVASRGIQKTDIRLVNYENSIEMQFPVEVRCWGIIKTEKLEWSRELTSEDNKTTFKDATNIKEIAKKLQENVRKGENVDLPVIAYFPARRIWYIPKKHKLINKSSRFRGYSNAIPPTSNYNFFTNWFKTKELAALQNQKDYFELQVVRKAISNCVDECEYIYYDIDTGALVMRFLDGRILPFTRLSDGVKNMMAVVSDIAYRCVTLNPHLREKALESFGIVLIDELDLHLHPSWQEKVVKNLKDTFPNIQFIATTHSPLILRSVTENDRIINLEDNDFYYIKHTYGRDVNDILKIAMDTEIRNKNLDDYFELIEMGKGKSKEALKLREKIERQSGENYHELARADALITFYE